MTYHWSEGSRPPKGIGADQVAAALAKLEEPSPENLLHATKSTKHCLHQDLWSEGDQVWANRGRIERCRHIIGAVKTEVVSGGRTVSIRAVEFVKVNGAGRWSSIESIAEDKDLQAAYLEEIQRLQDQAAAKLTKFRELWAG